MNSGNANRWTAKVDPPWCKRVATVVHYQEGKEEEHLFQPTVSISPQVKVDPEKSPNLRGSSDLPNN